MGLGVGAAGGVEAVTPKATGVRQCSLDNCFKVCVTPIQPVLQCTVELLYIESSNKRWLLLHNMCLLLGLGLFILTCPAGVHLVTLQ